MAESLRQETKLLLKHTSIYGAAPIIGKIVGFLMIPVYTRYLTPDDYGLMALVAITMNILSTVISVGTSNAMTRFYFDYEKQDERNKVVSSAYIGLGALVILSIGVLMIFVDYFAINILDDIDKSKYFYVALSSLGLNIINGLSINYFRINKKSKIVVSISTISLFVNISIILYLLVGLKLGVYGIFLGNLILSFLQFIFITPYILKKVKFNISWSVIKDLFAFGLPLIPSNLASYIVTASDRFFIKEYVSFNQTGIYSLSYQFGTLINNFVTTPFNQIWGPRRIEMFKDSTQQIFSRIFTYFSFVLVFVGLGISVLAENTIKIMAENSFWESYKLVPLITFAHIIFSFYYHFYVGIIIEKKTKFFAYINIINAIINLVLNFILIPKYGIWGAAVSTFISCVLRSSLCFYFSNRLHKITVEWKRIFLLLAIGLVMYYVISNISFDQIAISFSIKFILTLFYPVILFLMNFFYIEEKKEIKKYIQKLLNKQN